MLDYTLEVEIADERSIQALRVHRGCVSKMYDECYAIELVPIPLRGNKVIVGMD